jgi:hypothetical protein
MNTFKIIQMAKLFGFESFLDEKLNTGNLENFWECDQTQLLKFAKSVYELGYEHGTNNTYERELRIKNQIRD